MRNLVAFSVTSTYIVLGLALKMDSRRHTFVAATNQLIDSLQRTIDSAKETFSRGQDAPESKPIAMSFEQLALGMLVIGEPAWTVDGMLGVDKVDRREQQTRSRRPDRGKL